MIKYIFLTLFIISIIACVYYLYASVINKKLNNKKLYIGEDASRNRYTIKTNLSISCVIGTFGLFMFSMFYIPGVSLMNSFSSAEEFNSIKPESNVITLLNYNNEKSEFNYEYAKANEKSVYVATNDKVIKYDIEKEINKYFVFDNYATNSSIYLEEDKVIVYAEYTNSSTIYVFDSNLNLINKFNINTLLKYIVINEGILNLITDIKINEEFKILLNNNSVDLLEYDELLYNITNINNIVVHSQINLYNYEIKQKGICVNNINYIYNNYLFIVTTKHNSNNLVINELYQYDIVSQNVINIKDLAGKVISLSKSYNDLLVILNFGDNIDRNYLIEVNNQKLDVILYEMKVNEENLETIIFDTYCNSFISNGNNVQIISYTDFNVYTYSVVKENNVYSFLKINNDYKVVYKERTSDSYLAYTNKYLIDYDYNGIKEIKVINDSIGE